MLKYLEKSEQARIAQADEKRGSIRLRLTRLKSMQEQLLNLRLSGGIDDQIFIQKKNELTTEQIILEEELGRAENPEAGLLNLARKTLDFQANVIYRFQKGTPQTKRLILQIIGSNLFLKDRKLLLDFKKPFLEIAEAKNTPDGQKQPFEPMETIENTGQNAENQTVCPAPSGRLDSNQRPPEPHSGALPGCATPRN